VASQGMRAEHKVITAEDGSNAIRIRST